MSRSTLARRYAPLVAIAGIQLLLVATVPSVAPKLTSSAGPGGSGIYGSTGPSGGSGASAGGVSVGTGGMAGASGATGAVAVGNGIAGSTGTSGASGTGAGGAGAGPGGQGGGGGASAASLTSVSHCVDGREFSPSIAYWAPPCVPGTPGGPYPDNGGSTSMGVTAKQITIVDYWSDGGAEVDALLQALGDYESFSDAQALDAVYQNFLNKYYVLYGRTVKIITYQGQCTTVPPDTNCLIPEMDKIAAEYHPYAVYMAMTLCSACYIELARDHVITFGGCGFSDALANANAPYFYSECESSTRIETAFAQWYCNQLASSPVQFAETKNPLQNFNGKPRVLGIMGINDPDNEDAVMNILVPELKQMCGVTVNHFYFWAQNINTAEQQAAAAIAAMDTTSNPATTVVCMCDPLEPDFFYQGEQQNDYYPENVIGTDQGIDTDLVGQGYEGTGLACPEGGECPFDLAFGIGSAGPQEPPSDDEGTRMYALGGGRNLPSDESSINEITAMCYSMFGNLMENAGPDLTPANMQARAPSMGTVGGGSTGEPLLGFAPNDWQWTQDQWVVYWDRNKISPYNGQPGSFVQIEGSRFNLGQYPKLHEPPIPANRT